MSTKRDRSAYILILPSLFTTGNLFCGFYSLIRAFNHDFEAAAYAILLAGIFDVLDGRVARITKSQSDFGLEYDSIADVVSFGIAPAVLSYIWALQSFGRRGWSTAFLFAACGALRLARFNAIASETPKSYFLGLPIPAAANTIACFIIAYHNLRLETPDTVMLVLTLVLALLMVSTVRYPSFKDFDLSQKRGFFQLVVLVILLALVAMKPQITLLIAFGYYAAWGPVSELFRWFARKNWHRPTESANGQEGKT